MNDIKKEISITQDGSVTIHMPELNESYHSKHGAIQEAYHVFIQNGLDFFTDKNKVSILEIGFGTGLNAFITLLEAQKRNQTIHYTGVEAYPVNSDIYKKLNYPEQLNQADKDNTFLSLHQAEWQKNTAITQFFSLEKNQMKFEEITFENRFDLIYFDAFGYRVQPELWSEAIFSRMYRALKPGGILTTYACRSLISNNLKSAGFEIKKVPGPVGKREMTIAYKMG